MIKKIILFAFVSIIFSYSNAAYGSAVYSGEKDTVDCPTCITPEELEFRNQNPQLVDRIGLEMTLQKIDIPLSYFFTIYPNGDYSEKNYVNCMTCIVQDDGINVKGESINPPKTTTIAFGEKEIKGLQKLTQNDIISDLWEDEYGNVYQDVGNNRFDRISESQHEKIRDLETKHGCDRTCNWFTEYKQTQQIIAQKKLNEIFGGKSIFGELKEPITIYFSPITRAENTELQNAIQNEMIRAQETFEKTYYENRE